AIRPQLARRHPHCDALSRWVRLRDEMIGAGYRPRLFAPATLALLRRLKPREQSAALARLELRSAEVESVLRLDAETRKIVQALTSRKTAAPSDAYSFLVKVPIDILAYLLAIVSK